MNAPATVRLFACGVSESGKGFLLRKLFLSRTPRALILDPLGEHLAAGEQDRKAFKYYLAESVDQVRAALRRAVQEGPRWRIIAPLSPKDAPAVARILVPDNVQPRHSFSMLAGGLTVVCEELDQIAQTNADPAVEGMWRRGRHFWVSVLGATQRPHRVSRITTSQSTHFLVTKTHEPADLDYLDGFLPVDAMRAVRALPWQYAVLYDVRGGRWLLLDRQQRKVASGARESLTPSSEGL